ncbi:MAG: hypothetical protein K6E28_11655 [Eubacterium sp.]|nr:hypothetical protein [Eubacterium sp.]
MKSKNLKKIVSLFLAFAIIATVFFAVPNKVDAATTQVKTGVTLSNYKKAQAVKLGTSKVILCKNSSGTTKFVVPSTGTYVFKISNVSAPGKKLNGFVSFYTPVNYLQDLKGRTQGGTEDTLRVANSAFLSSWNKNNNYQKSTPANERYLSYRTMKVKLTKGQKVYMSAFFAGAGTAKPSYILKITKA